MTNLPSKMSPQRPANEGTHRRARVTGKLKAALDLMIFGGERGVPLDYAAAARNANLTVRAMRKALEKGHVRAYLRTQRHLFRASVCAGNISALRQIRDTSKNDLARVKAIQVLEQLEDNAVPDAATQRAPGLTICIVPAPEPPPPYDSTLIEYESSSQVATPPCVSD
jgi:hypothetical protein